MMIGTRPTSASVCCPFFFPLSKSSLSLIDDILNILGSFSAPPPSFSTGFQKRCISLTTTANLLILHPDILLTATALSNAPQCMRKPILSSLVRSTSDITPALVWGSMLHEVMQRCLLEKKWDDPWIDECLHNAISGGLGELVKLGISEEVALMEMKERAKHFKVFAERYLGDLPKVFCFRLLLNHFY